ncbi:MAG: putative glycosyltransferase [Myxococcales bacterium]|nr:putative glycosyltransferase [Myxococcales bacterium]
MKVSIVTPSYNQAQFLEETIVSVLEQDYPNIEYVVVDDASTDGSLEIARRYESRLHKLVVQENAGQVAALNHGFRHTDGELLGWLNSDDVLLPGAVSAVVRELERDPQALLVYGDNVFIDEAGNRIPRERASAEGAPFDPVTMVRRCKNWIPQPGSLFRRRALELAPLNERGYYFFDFEFALRLGASGRVKYVPGLLAEYRLHADSKTVGEPLRRARDFVRIADEFFASPDFPPSLAPYARAGRASAYLEASELAYNGLDLAVARRYFAHGAWLAHGRISRRALGIGARVLLPERLVSRLRTRRHRSASES